MLQQIPLAVTVLPPSSEILPPPKAPVEVIEFIADVVTEGKEVGLSSESPFFVQLINVRDNNVTKKNSFRCFSVILLFRFELSRRYRFSLTLAIGISMFEQ